MIIFIKLTHNLLKWHNISCCHIISSLLFVTVGFSFLFSEKTLIHFVAIPNIKYIMNNLMNIHKFMFF